MQKILRFTIIIYLSYLAIALAIITPALNFFPHKYLRDNYQRKLDTGMLWFNPFTVSLEIRQAALPELDGEEFFSLDEASVNFSLSSLWQPGLVFDAIRVSDIFVHVRLLDAGTFNFSDLLPAESARETVEPEPSPLGLTVLNVDIQSRELIYTDQQREKPFTSRLQGLHLQAQDFSTVIEDGRPYQLELSDESGGRIAWQGELSIPQGHSQGQLVLENVGLRALWRFAEPWVKFELTEGLLHTTATYEIDWLEGLQYRLTGGAFGLSDVSIAAREATTLPDTGVQLRALTVTGIAVDSRALHAEVADLALDGLVVSGFSEGASVSLQELFTPVAAGKAAAAEQAGAAQDSPEPWTAVLRNARISDSGLHWRSEFTNPQTASVNALQVSASNIHWPLAGSSDLSLALTLNQQAQLSIDGQLDLAQGAGSLNYQIKDLLLAWFDPALPVAFRADLASGSVQAAGSVELAAFAPTRLTLDGAIADFAMRQQDAETTFTGWKNLGLESLDLALDERSLALQKLSIDGLEGRLSIASDGTINTSNLWQPQDDAGASEQTLPQSGEAAAVAAPATAASGEVAAAEEPAAPWLMSIPLVTIKDSAIDFEDKSLPLPFRTVIGDLNGEVVGLDSTARSSASVTLDGSVDGYAPVALKGDFNPLASPAMLDLVLTFEGVDLARVTPYSGTYAGYAIDSGLLYLDLHYTLSNNHLKGRNKVIVNQLQLGEKVDSDKALDIPLQLALSLLTDANGVIDMRIPIEGDINDPKFKLGGVITGAFVKLITKAITAPFSLLAGLVNSKEDLQHLTFAAGSATLDDATRSKLDQLGQALEKRPNLSLIIRGRLNPKADREQLRRTALNQQLLDSGLSQDSLQNKDAQWEQAIDRRFSGLSAEPPPTALQQYQALVDTIEIDEAQLATLVQERATAVKTYLVSQAGLGPDKAVIQQAKKKDDKQAFAGVELVLGD